jgi:hypothetical protein
MSIRHDPKNGGARLLRAALMRQSGIDTRGERQ